MHYELVWGGDPEDLLVVTAGLADVDELHAMVQDALADRRFREGLAILLDHTRTQWWTLTVTELLHRADLIRALADRIGEQRIAFVGGSLVDTAVGRVLKSLIDGHVSFTSGVFDSLPAARDWLWEDRRPGHGSRQSASD